MDNNWRARVVLNLVLMGWIQMHAKIILAQDVAEYAPLFSEIADAYFEREMYAEAGHIYEMLGGDAGVCFEAGYYKTTTNDSADEQHARAPSSRSLSAHGWRPQGGSRGVRTW